MKIFDTHFHIIDKQFPLIRLNNYLPPEFTVKDYLERTSGLNIKAGALVAVDAGIEFLESVPRGT